MLVLIWLNNIKLKVISPYYGDEYMYLGDEHIKEL